MYPTISWLLGKPQLRLKIVGETADPRYAARAAAPVSWVHSSDLDDPTPFLSAGNVLLTDGAQFGFGPAAAAYDYAGYVQRLVDAQLVGLGFATHFLHQGTPPELAEACQNVGLPLIEVPDRVPFIAVIREVADQIGAERSQRLEWSIAAHKAISRAALKPDGLRSILLELERRLDCWVGLFDAGGTHLFATESDANENVPSTLVRTSVAQALSKGRRSASSLTLDASHVTIQTLGHGGQLRGALALSRTAPFDSAERELVTSVIALASLALQQNRQLDSAQAQLRSVVIDLLLAGSPAAARSHAERLGSMLPSEPFVVFVVAGAAVVPPRREQLGLLSPEIDGRIFHATHGANTILLTEPDTLETAVALAIAAQAQPAGSAAVTDYSLFTTGLAQATAALVAASGRPGVVPFANIADTGMLGLLQTAQAEQVAREVLTQLIEFDERHSTALVSTLRVWFAQDCSWGQTATRLQLHRHTVRSRIDQAATILGRDLESFEGRLEVWAAVKAIS